MQLKLVFILPAALSRVTFFAPDTLTLNVCCYAGLLTSPDVCYYWLKVGQWAWSSNWSPYC